MIENINIISLENKKRLLILLLQIFRSLWYGNVNSESDFNENPFEKIKNC